MTSVADATCGSAIDTSFGVPSPDLNTWKPGTFGSVPTSCSASGMSVIMIRFEFGMTCGTM